MLVFEIEMYLTMAATLVLVAVKVFALVNSLLWPANAYSAADKLSKVGWAAILGIGALAQVVLVSAPPIHPIHLIFTIATFVYLADVRPKLAEVTKR